MPVSRDLDAIAFCEDFCNSRTEERYVLGRNVYTQAIMAELEIAGVIDDFCEDTTFGGVPIVCSGNVPKGSLVLNASGGRPFSARTRLERLGLRNLDYFSFYRLAGVPLRDIIFNEGFKCEFETNIDEYSWIERTFADGRSQEIFRKLVGFRRTLEIGYLEGFTDIQNQQYFESFLNLRPDGEVFADVGCFDGSNSLEFAKRAPNYRSIHAFEPDPGNFAEARTNLGPLRDVYLHNVGLSDKEGTLNFSSDGSESKISPSGGIEIAVGRMDTILAEDPPSFIKMDIEGAEYLALCGARQIISSKQPRLAVCVYHSPGDFHRIPRLILGICDDYDVYLRHYTETIYETVMFFIPRSMAM